MWRLLAVFFICVLPSLTSADKREALFESKIRPLLVNHCVECHGPESQEGNLRLDSRGQMFQGTESVDSLVAAGQPDQSRLYQVIQYHEDEVQMPPKGKLSSQQISDVATWIQQGAYWPDHSNFGAAEAFDPDGWKQHWAFQPVTDVSLPRIHQANWHPIDSYIRQKLQIENLAPSKTATGRVLVRRLAYDITGLPPTEGDLEAASQIANKTTLHEWLNVYTDRLLASQSFGERWGRYWLDIARYADTKGYVFREDRSYPDAWRFREWVIRSMNADLPYDEFLKRQIAADLLPVKNDVDQLAAMGFLTLGRRFLNNKHDIIDDRIDVLARGTLGLTVACARCHDHKFDPIPTADYYALYGIFDSSEEPKDRKSTLQLVDRAKPRQPFIFVRGQAGNRGDRVPRRFLTALGGSDDRPFTQGSGRLELAQKIAAKNNPLTARVAVNRIWMRLFGRGLVESASDFGVRTSQPSHPQLLDHLARRFTEDNWSRKELIRYITKSMTYRQSSDDRPDVGAVDPENRLVARMIKRRLNFEAMRDSILAASTNLDSNTIGGPSVDITTVPSPNRRTIYAHIDRQNLPGVFRTFDLASPDSTSASRHETTVPQQALFQFNSPFMMEQAQKTSEVLGLSNQTPSSDLTGIQQLYHRILQREATEDEFQMASEFLTAENSKIKERPKTGWQYGWGEIDESKQRVVVFNRFDLFHDQRYSGGRKLPDPKIGWCMLTATGGHPGGDRAHCVIRRWVADRDCKIHFTGRIKHKSKNGDGVQGLILQNGQALQQISAFNRSAKFESRTQIKAGETIDFVTFCGENESHDSFDWPVTIFQFVGNQSVGEWNSETDFTGLPPSPLSKWAQLAQVLMMTNEFTFVD